MLIPIDSIVPNPEQPRKDISDDTLSELAESIRMHGLINPIAVEAAPGFNPTGAPGAYFILIDGERRWRAAKLAGLTEIEASVRPGMNGTGSLERLILATTANLQREDMTAVEKALAFQKLMDAGLSMADTARLVGLSAASVDNYLLILRLPEKIQGLVQAGELSAGARAVRALLNITDADMQLVIARAAAKKRLPEAGVVSLARRMQQGKNVARRNKAAKSKPELSAFWNGRWNMIAQAGNPHISAELKEAAVETCENCALFDDASPKVCRDCPAVELLRKIVRGANES